MLSNPLRALDEPSSSGGSGPLALAALALLTLVVLNASFLTLMRWLVRERRP